MMHDSRPTPSAPDDDPYLWLEDIDGAKAAGWADAETAASLDGFGRSGFTADRDALKTILDRPDNIPYIARRGALVFNFWKDAEHPRGLWRSATLDRFRAGEPDWTILLDLDRLAADENEDWIWQGASTLPPHHKLAIVRLSRGGGDAAVLREFDMLAKAFVAGGFLLPEAKSDAHWLDRDAWLVSSALGEGMATASGYPRTARIWTRGQDIAQAPIVAEVPQQSMGLWAFPDRTQAAETIHFVEKPDFYETLVHIGDRTGPKTRLDLPADIDYAIDRDWLAVKRRGPWTMGEAVHPQDTLLGIELSAFLAGDRTFHVVFQPGERRALRSFFWVGGKLVLSILDDLTPTFEIVDPGQGWSAAQLKGLPKIAAANVWPLDMDAQESNGDLLANVEGPLTPPAFMLLEPGKTWEVLRRAPEAFSADGMVVSRHEAVSVDGAKIPYTQFGPKGETGDAPVHLYGYGGFDVTILPDYQPGLGKLWLERGGTRVIAHIRGGGDFGTRWHDAGRREKKRLFCRRRRRSCRARRHDPWKDRGGRRLEWRHSHHEHARPLPSALRRAALHRPAHRHAALFEASRGRELDRRIWRPRQSGGLGVFAGNLSLSPGEARPNLSAYSVRHSPQGRPRPSRPCAEDGGEAAGDGIRGPSL
jgi:prolyl oligopeptidase